MGLDVRPAGIPGTDPQTTSAVDNSLTTAQIGESSLADVALRLGVTEEALRQANPNIGSGVKPGQDVRLPPIHTTDVTDLQARQPIAQNGPPADTLLDSKVPSFPPGTRNDRDLSGDMIRSLLNTGVMLAGPQPNTPVSKSQFAGVRLGTSQSGADVRVTREIGSTKGYDDEMEAIAVARMSRAENSAVVQGKDGKWHTVETNETLANTGPGQTPPAHGLPPFSAIDATRRRIQALQDTSDALGKQIDATRQAGFPVDELVTQRDAMVKQITQAHRQLAANVLGVPESEINVVARLRDAQPGKINIVAQIDGALGEHHPEGGVNYEQHRPGIVSIRRDQIEDPQLIGQAAQELYHETAHRKDHEMTEQWVKRYQAETGRPFVDDLKAQGKFVEWMRKQVPGKISAADAETVLDNAAHSNAGTEARVNVHATLQALLVGRPDLASFELEHYVSGIANGRYGNPGRDVEAELTAELRAAYKQMTPDMQKQLRDVVAAAKAAYPDAWVSKLDFSKK